MLYKVLNGAKIVFIDGKRYVVKDGKVEVDHEVDLPFLVPEVVANDANRVRKDVDTRSGDKTVSRQRDTGRDNRGDKSKGKATKKK